MNLCERIEQWYYRIKYFYRPEVKELKRTEAYIAEAKKQMLENLNTLEALK